MRNTNTLLILQSLLASAQFINMSVVALAHPPLWLSLSAGALMIGLQTYVQHAGNQAIPPQMQQAQDMRNAAQKQP